MIKCNSKSGRIGFRIIDGEKTYMKQDRRGYWRKLSPKQVEHLMKYSHLFKPGSPHHPPAPESKEDK